MKRLALWVAAAAAVSVPAMAQDVGQGIALYNEGRFAEAEPVLRAADGTDAHAYLAATLERLARHAEAEAEANAALQADPVNAVAVAALGESLVMQNRLDDAIARMSTALGAKADLAYAYYWRGQAYQRNKQIARMVEDYQNFLKLRPDAPESPSLKVLLAGFR